MSQHPFIDEIRPSLAAALQLARQDRSAIQRFDLTEGGFWRSFAAALLVLPMAVLYMFAKRRVWIQAIPPLHLPAIVPQMAIELAIYVIDWATLPILMIFIARRFALTRHYVPFVIAWNWSNVIAALFALPPAILLFLGLARPQDAAFLNLAATVLAVAYQQRVAQVALGIPLLASLAIPILDLVMGYGLDYCANTIEQAVA